MKAELKILREAREAGLTVQVVTFRAHGKRDRRKGYDLIDPLTAQIQYTFEPINTGIYNKGYKTNKWLIHHNNRGPRYATRLTSKEIDLHKRERTGWISTTIAEKVGIQLTR